MNKWADYLMLAVHFRPNVPQCFSKAVIVKDYGCYFGDENILCRYKIIEMANEGKSFATIYKNDMGFYTLGDKLELFKIHDYDYLKINKNKRMNDELGSLPRINTIDKDKNYHKNFLHILNNLLVPTTFRNSQQ